MPSDLNVIVGLNDVGKSNLLKALNLFFNGETDFNTKFRFEDDFCKFATVRKHAAPEIEISITFKIPDRYKKQGKIIWKKKWRRGSSEVFKSEITDETGREYSANRGKTQVWLQRLRYYYIPAIKDDRFFSYLIGEMHDALNEVDSQTFGEASHKFIDGIERQVESLVNEIGSKLNYNSSISIPSDFKQLFSTLTFVINDNKKDISLLKHGDGIKAQYIPIVLKFIAQTLQRRHGKEVNSDIIWGFEEPENNLEMSKAFDLAKVFFEYSKGIQIFINTHSPAFYLLSKKKHVNLFWAEKKESATEYKQHNPDDLGIINEKIGLAPIIADYVSEKEIELKELREKISSITNNQKKYIVYSEDEDLEYINFLLKQYVSQEDLSIQSYHGRTNILQAMLAYESTNIDSSIVKSIIFHRDRDTYNDDEPDKERIEKKLNVIKAKNKNINVNLFITEGYDIESYFLNENHIVEVCRKHGHDINLDEVKKIIDNATNEVECKSIDKLMDNPRYIEDFKKSRSSTYEKIKKEYQNNKQRYRYGKTVLGVVKQKLQAMFKENINLLEATKYLCSPRLEQILNTSKK